MKDAVNGHTNRPSGGNGVPLREFVTLWIERLEDFGNERDRRYTEKFEALEKGVSAAFAASEKAITKAETANEKRFDAVNEFRGTLADQAATLLTRSEAEQRFKTDEAAITGLQVWQGERTGSHTQEGQGRAQNNWLIGAVLGGLALLASIINTALIVALK